MPLSKLLLPLAACVGLWFVLWPGCVTAQTASPAATPSAQDLAAAQRQAQDAPADFARQMQAGDLFYQAKRYAEAIQFYRTANQLRPQAAEPLIALGDACFADADARQDNEQWLQARKWYAAALALEPENLQVRVAFGSTFMLQEPPDYERARQEFQEVLALDPTREGAWENLILTLIYQGDLVTARKGLTALTAINRKNSLLPELRRLLAAANRELAQTKTAALRQPKDFEAQMNAAVACYRNGALTQAEFYLKRALALKPDDVDALTGLANTQYDQGKYAAAQETYEKALAQKPDPDLQTDLGNTYFKRQDYARAIIEYRKALALAPQHEKAWQNLAAAAIRLGDTTTAREAVEKLAVINPDNPALPDFRTEIGMPKSGVQLPIASATNPTNQGTQLSEAISLAENSLAKLEKEKGPDSQEVVIQVYSLATLYYNNDEYQRAEPLFLRVLALYEKQPGSLGAEAAVSTLNYLGLLCVQKTDNERALAFYQRALAIAEKNLAKGHTFVATTLNNLALLYRTQDDYQQAALFFQRALEILEKAIGPEEIGIAVALNNLADTYLYQGDYGRAISLSQRALKIFEKASADILVANTLNSLAKSYVAQGNYGEALPLYKRALAIYEKSGLEQQPIRIFVLINLAQFYREQGDYNEALPLCQQALTIAEKTLGPENFVVATALDTLAQIYHDQGDYQRALPYYQRSLTIYEKTSGPEHRFTATALNNLAGLYHDTGDYARALPLYQRALAISEKILGPEHPDVAKALDNLAELYHAKGDFQRTLAFQQRASAIEETNIALALNAGSQQQKQLYLNTLSNATTYPVSLNIQNLPSNPDAARLALTVILQRKGRALNAFSDQLAALRQRAQPDDQKLLDELAATLTRLANLQLGKDSKLAPDALRAEIARLNADKERLEDAISRRSAEFRALALPVTLDAVRQALPADAALVEFFVYHPFNPKAKPNAQYGTPRYVAYLLTRDSAAPLFVELGQAAALEALLKQWRAALLNPKSADVKALGRAVDAQVMQPVRKLLGDTKRLFISPDGALNLVPFAALVDENDKFLVETYSLNYLTSGRDLLRLQIPPDQKPDAPVILANPQFDLTRPVVNCKAGQRGLGLLSDTPDAKIDYRGTDFTQLCYSTLSGTAQEAAQLGPLLTDAKVWTQKDATEAALKSLRRPRVLHIATHGFFFPDQPDAKPDGRGLGLLSDNAPPRPVNGENPLLRSGLILAGVKQRQSGPDNDGVLTALEAAGLNLFGTKLVVLSACETGLGEVANGQGVYGLRRALVLAGSETQVMSLWKVADTATAALMTSYYTRLQRGEGRSEAMRAVQLEMLKNGKLAASGETRKIEQEGEKGKAGPADWRHPYYWAAFIQSGAWTSLDGK